MGIETSAYMALEIARMRCWERGDGLGAVNRVAATSVGHNREGLEEAGQAGASAGHRHLPGTREQTLESGSKVLAGCISLGKWGGSCTAPLPAAGEGLQDGKLVARAGCSRRANNTSGEKVRWAAARAAPLTGCHPSPSAARASRKVLGCLGGELLLQPPPPSAGFQGRQWQPAVSGSPHGGVEQCNRPQHQLLLSRPCTASSTSPHRALLPHPSRTWQPPGRPSCRPTTANVPAERVFLAEKLLSSLWKQ